mmetsp:Transcript_56469/g.133042  ORF Transcript_56469/g.133042 Transcript_56469/m.133042 type:complete len:218 (+) Transcript_56469:138-791(+)
MSGLLSMRARDCSCSAECVSSFDATFWAKRWSRTTAPRISSPLRTRSCFDTVSCSPSSSSPWRSSSRVTRRTICTNSCTSSRVSSTALVVDVSSPSIDPGRPPYQKLDSPSPGPRASSSKTCRISGFRTLKASIDSASTSSFLRSSTPWWSVSSSSKSSRAEPSSSSSEKALLGSASLRRKPWTIRSRRRDRRPVYHRIKPHKTQAPRKNPIISQER